MTMLMVTMMMMTVLTIRFYGTYTFRSDSSSSILPTDWHFYIKRIHWNLCCLRQERRRGPLTLYHLLFLHPPMWILEEYREKNMIIIIIIFFDCLLLGNVTWWRWWCGDWMNQVFSFFLPLTPPNTFTDTHETFHIRKM